MQHKEQLEDDVREVLPWAMKMEDHERLMRHTDASGTAGGHLQRADPDAELGASQ